MRDEGIAGATSDPDGEMRSEPTAAAVESVVRGIQERERRAAGQLGSQLPAPPPDTERGPIPYPSAPARLAAGSTAVRRSRRRPGALTGHEDRRLGSPSRAPVRWPRLGLVGRVEWERLVADEAERQRRYGRPSAIVLAEIHGLERVTAQVGSRGIERVVPPCGATLVAIARASDRVTRLGDGRFGILLRETDAAGAGRYAERARTACDDWLAALPWSVDLTVRWAAPDGAEDLVGALRRAERELVAATVTATPDVPSTSSRVSRQASGAS